MSEIFTREQAKASDHVLYDLMMATARVERNYEGEMTSIHYTANDERTRRYDSRSPWKMSGQEAVDTVVAMSKDEALPGFKRQDAEKSLARLRAAIDAVKVAEAAQAEQDKEWAEHGRWPRYTVVPGGHIHKEMGCFTFHRGNQRTDVRWAYPVSGDSVEEAIEVYGAALCTHCYPDAPVEKTLDRVGIDADGNPMTKAEMTAVKDARQAEKDAKLAAKNATQVVDPFTGEVLFKTERAATNAISSNLGSMRWYGESHPSYQEWADAVELVVVALASKRGVDPAELRAELDARADKKADADLKKAWKALKADCAAGRWTRSIIDFDSKTVQYGKSIGEELVFGREG